MLFIGRGVPSERAGRTKVFSTYSVLKFFRNFKKRTNNMDNVDSIDSIISSSIEEEATSDLIDKLAEAVKANDFDRIEAFDIDPDSGDVKAIKKKSSFSNSKDEEQNVDILELLKSIEWSGSQQGPGSGPMASGGDGVLSQSCPVCRQINPKDPYVCNWIDEAVGHKSDCMLKKALNQLMKDCQ